MRAGREEPDRPGNTDAGADPVAVAREIVLRQLTMRARSRSELASALRRRGVPEEAAEEVLGRFTELGLIDDEAFARQWVSTQQRRSRGRRVLREELRGKGVAADTIEDALADVDDEDEHAAALAFARKRAAATAGLDRAARYRRLVGALGRRGFPGGLCHRVAQEALGETPDGIEPD